ncbi:pilin [Enterovibrio norvegicus]|uniref:pilin n=1 Tax=Enterovibrio norvegicus TaxID=188144 RepID=UPI000C8284B1|nr:prepilin-type N-terminal cleavage/methylation domain-containing protein [Enterovibrio norvegicus]
MKKQKGFSLIELLIVVGIIGALTAIAVPTYQKFQEKSEVVAAIGTMKNLQSVIDSDILDGKGFVTQALLSSEYGITADQVTVTAGAAKNDGSLKVTKENIFITNYARAATGKWTCTYNAANFDEKVGNCAVDTDLTIPPSS